MYVCTCMFLRVVIHSHGDQTTMGAGSSILWVLEIKLRSSGLAASAFTLRVPSCHPAAECLIWHCWWKWSSQQQFSRHYWKMILFFGGGCSSNSSSAGFRLNYCSSVTSDSGCLRLQDEFGVCFVALPQEEGLPGFRGVKSAGESPKGQSLCEIQGLPAAVTATLLHLSRSSLQVLLLWTKSLQATGRKK